MIARFYKSNELEEIVLVGHSLGGSVAILAGEKFSDITSVVALCPAITFGRSDHKWGQDGFRHSKKDLPDDPNQFRQFSIPVSFVEDRRQYSVVDVLKKITKPLMILVAMKDDPGNIQDIEHAITLVQKPHVVKMEDLGHDFRQSEEQCLLVSQEIKNFLK